MVGSAASCFYGTTVAATNVVCSFSVSPHLAAHTHTYFPSLRSIFFPHSFPHSLRLKDIEGERKRFEIGFIKKEIERELKENRDSRKWRIGGGGEEEEEEDEMKK